MAVGLAAVKQLATAALFGGLIETGFYFAYLLSFPISLWCLYRNKAQRAPVNKVIMAITLLLFLSVSTHWILTIVRLYQGFIKHSANPLSTSLYYAKMSDPIELAKVSTYVMVGTLMDCMLIYRLYVVWGRSWLVAIIPTLATLAQLGGFVVQIRDYADIDLVLDALHDKPTGPFVILNYCATLSVTLFATAMITYRILANNSLWRRSSKYNTWSLLKPVLQIVIEGAVVYGLLSFLVLCLYLTDSPYTFLALDILPPIVGVNHSAILIRVHVLRSPSSVPAPPSASGHSHQHTHSADRRLVSPIADGMPIKAIRHVGDEDEEAGAYPLREVTVHRTVKF